MFGRFAVRMALAVSVMLGMTSPVKAEDGTTMLPESMVGMAGNIGFGIVISYLWSADSKRKDELIRDMLKSHDDNTRRMIEEISRMARSVQEGPQA